MNEKLFTHNEAKQKVKMLEKMDFFECPEETEYLEGYIAQNEKHNETLARFLRLMEKPFTSHADETEFYKLKEALLKMVFRWK